jgi:hypothetical protein
MIINIQVYSGGKFRSTANYTINSFSLSQDIFTQLLLGMKEKLYPGKVNHSFVIPNGSNWDEVAIF